MRDSKFTLDLNEHNNKKKKYQIVILILLLILGIVGTIVYRNSDAYITKQKVELANKYMIEKEYEQAISTYEEVLDIRPESAEASLGIVEAYIATENYKKAFIYAKKGYENTKNKEIKLELEVLDSGLFVYTTMDKSKKIYYLPDGILHGIDEYDANRNTFVETFYTAVGLLDYIIEHDDMGNGIRMDYNSEGILEILKEYGNKELVDKEYYYNEDETINCYVVYEYNDAGNLIHETSYDMDDILNFEYEYDENENISKAFTYGIFGSLNYYYVYKYDVQGNMIEEFVFNSNGTIKYKRGYEYDEYGNAIKKLYYSGNGTLSYYELIKYDERGNQINWVRYNADGTDWSL